MYADQPRMVQVEEAIAEMTADFITGRNDIVNKVVAKLADIIRAIGEAVKRVFHSDYVSGHRVLRGIESGAATDERPELPSEEPVDFAVTPPA